MGDANAGILVCAKEDCPLDMIKKIYIHCFGFVVL
jgi:hypothetical protein